MDEMISEFITETMESLSLLDQELVRLEQNPQDNGILSNIFRVMHTIKGTCGFLGLHRLEKVAHAGENILGKFRDGVMAVTPQAVTLILQSVDCIKGIIDHIAQSGSEPEGNDSTLIKSLDRFAEGGGVEEASPEPEAEPEDASHFFKGDADLEELIRKMEAQQKPSATVAAAPEKPASPVLVATKPAPAAPAPAAHPPEAKENKDGGNAANQSIRVSLDVLEKMMQMVSELVLSRNQLMQIVRNTENKEFQAPLQQLSHITSELQESVMKTRMQPIGNAWSKFPRLVRDLSLELGKKIDLKMIGEETELDRQLLEAVKDPLTHMVRNSCDHGLERPDDRRATGKPEGGTVTLKAYHDGGHIVIDIIDDGRGINTDKIKEKAIANGLATPAELAAMGERQILQFIFRAGFSTAEKVTSVSGRGVGMDVVRTNIEKIGGTIDLSSTMGQGSKVSIKIPLTLAIVSVLIVETNGERFAIPQINVNELLQVGDKLPIKLEQINGAAVIRLRESLLPTMSLGTILGLTPAGISDAAKEKSFVVVCNTGQTSFGVIVDRVHNIEEIVVKPVSEAVKSVPLFSGNTILGDGNVIMILDPTNLASAVGDVTALASNTEGAAAEQQESGDVLTSFLLFSYGPGSPKAVPLELVWRLEEIEVSKIERAGGAPVVQYRGDLMRLLKLGAEHHLPDEGIAQVIVFSYDGRTVGLPVGEIIDIVHIPFALQIHSADEGYLGSMVVSGHSTDIVDVSHLLEGTISVQNFDAPLVKKQDKNVLLIDDSPFLRKMTIPFLTAAGYRVVTAENGIEGLAALEQSAEPFDIIVTDLQMPSMDGFQFAEACRSFPRFAAVPIIGFTASLEQDSVDKCQKVGMVTCVQKNNRPGLLEAMANCRSKLLEAA